jgi:hypothetical protein
MSGADVAVRRLESRCHVVGDRVGRQRRKLNRRRLAVERLRSAKQLAHHADLRAGEDIARRLNLSK